MFAQGSEYVKPYVNIGYDFFINSLPLRQANNPRRACLALAEARAAFGEGSGVFRRRGTMPPPRVALTPAVPAAAAVPFPAPCWEPSWAQALVCPPAAALPRLRAGGGCCRRPGKEPGSRVAAGGVNRRAGTPVLG